MSAQRGGCDLTVDELLERNMALGQALAGARYARDCYMAVLEGMEFEKIADMPTKGTTFCRAIGQQAKADILSLKASLRPEATPFSRSRKVLADLEGTDVRRVLEQSDLPIELATAIADVCEPEADLAQQLTECRQRLTSEHDAHMECHRKLEASLRPEEAMKELESQRDNLAMLVRMLVHTVRNTPKCTGQTLADNAMNYLCMKGLHGSESTPQKESP